ncbi:hypothetical protein N9057_05675 [Akkermansiaceae bacterium]|nr:hypothetical protein [Akkermansiaceae bacterium]
MLVSLVGLPPAPKALLPMLVTLAGIVMLARLVRQKAASPMLVTGKPSMVSGMTNSPVAGTPGSEIPRSLPVIVTSPLAVVHVRFSNPTAWRGRNEPAKRARNAPLRLRTGNKPKINFKGKNIPLCMTEIFFLFFLRKIRPDITRYCRKFLIYQDYSQIKSLPFGGQAINAESFYEHEKHQFF